MFITSRRLRTYIDMCDLKGFVINRFSDFYRSVNRFLSVSRLNRPDHRVPEVETVQIMYIYVGFDCVPNLPVF